MGLTDLLGIGLVAAVLLVLAGRPRFRASRARNTPRPSPEADPAEERKEVRIAALEAEVLALQARLIALEAKLSSAGVHDAQAHSTDEEGPGGDPLHAASYDDGLTERLREALDLLDLPHAPFPDAAAIRAAWRRKVRESHPDAGGAGADMDRLQAARDCLLDWISRNST